MTTKIFPKPKKIVKGRNFIFNSSCQLDWDLTTDDIVIYWHRSTRGLDTLDILTSCKCVYFYQNGRIFRIYIKETEAEKFVLKYSLNLMSSYKLMKPTEQMYYIPLKSSRI